MSLWAEEPVATSTCTAVEWVDTALRCPVCRGPVALVTMTEAALFRHGGYGADRATAVRWCMQCRWALVHEVTDRRPAA